MKRSHDDLSTSPKSAPSDKKQPTVAEEGGFIGRWSRRKRDASAIEPTAEEVLLTDSLDQLAEPVENLPQNQDAASDTARGYESQTDHESPTEYESDTAALLTDEDMPDIETLNADSDFSPFFSDGVSKELRNLALKKLFFSGKFAARDGLDDYDDDFTKFEPLGDTVTSDMKFHARRKEKARLAELEEQRLLEAQQQENADDEVVAEEVTDDTATADAIESDVASADQSLIDQSEEETTPVDDMQLEEVVENSAAEIAIDEVPKNV